MRNTSCALGSSAVGLSLSERCHSWLLVHALVRGSEKRTTHLLCSQCQSDLRASASGSLQRMWAQGKRSKVSVKSKERAQRFVREKSCPVYLPAVADIVGCVVLDRACSWRWGGPYRADLTREWGTKVNTSSHNSPPLSNNTPSFKNSKVHQCVGRALGLGLGITIMQDSIRNPIPRPSAV